MVESKISTWLAAIIESRPNKVQNQGTPADNTVPLALGLLGVELARSKLWRSK